MHNYSCGGRWLLRLLFTIGNSQINFNPQARGIGSMDELQISPADSRESPGKEQQAAGVGILLQIMMLVLSFVLGHVLRRRRFYYLPEASASLLIGAWHRHESLCFGLWGVCLNDAMAISLYRTMSLMRSHISSEQNFFMVMKHYTFANLSDSSQRFVSAFFHLISSLAETFVVVAQLVKHSLLGPIGPEFESAEDLQMCLAARM